MKVPLSKTPSDELTASLRVLDKQSGGMLTAGHLAYMRINPVLAGRVAEALQQREDDPLTQEQAAEAFPSLVVWGGKVHEFGQALHDYQPRVLGTPVEPLLPFSMADLKQECRFGRMGRVGDVHELVWFPGIRLLDLYYVVQEQSKAAALGSSRLQVYLDGEPILRTSDLLAEEYLSASAVSDKNRWGLVYYDGLTSVEDDSVRRPIDGAQPQYYALNPTEAVLWLMARRLVSYATLSERHFRCSVSQGLRTRGVGAVTVGWRLGSIMGTLPSITIYFWRRRELLHQQSDCRWAVGHFGEQR